MQTTNLNLQPYFDDYNRSKNYYKVLFKPSFPVQARELTTLQSILQNQIERFGQHLFKDGSVVIPGQVGYDLFYNAVLIQPTVNGVNFESSFRSSLTGKILTGSSSGVKAKVINSISATTSEKQFATLYVKYISSGNVENGVQLTKFKNNEILVNESGQQVALTSTQNASAFTGSAAYITSGVFFIRGFFVDVPEQSIILDQYTGFSSCKIGLEIVESVVSASEDSSLYDNAVGSSNFSAPGADRLKIDAVLTKKDVDSTASESFIELIRLKDGELIKIVENTVYNELEKNLARRTFDESGNYTVSDYSLALKETYNNGENNGVYLLNDYLVDGTKILNRTPEESDGKSIDARNYYTLELSRIKAYVKGFEINNSGKSYTTVEKPRDSLSVNNRGIISSFGNYVEIDETSIIGKINPGEVVTLKNTNNSIETVIGKARVLSLQGQGKLFLADITLYSAIKTTEDTPTLSQGDFVFLSNGSTAFVESISSNNITLSQINGTVTPGLSFTNSRNSFTYNINTCTNYKFEDVLSVTTSGFNANLNLDEVTLSGTSFVVTNNNPTSTITHTYDDSNNATISLVGTNGIQVQSQSTTSADGVGTVTGNARNVYQVSSGTGNATFTVTKNTDATYTVSILNPGSNYTNGQTLTISGTSLGGTSANNITLSSITINPITGVGTVNGSTKNIYSSIAGTGGGATTNATFNVTKNSNGTYSVAIANGGAGYTADATNIIITIPGTSLGGDSSNNITLTNATANASGVLTGVGTVSGNAKVSYTGVTHSSSSSNGSGATFDVTVNGSSYVVNIVSKGSGYVSGSTLTIPGTSLGGDSSNDLTLTGIVVVDGSIASLGTVTGSAKIAYNGITSSSGTATFNVGINNGSYIVSLATGGTGYTNNQSLTIPGTSLGGLSPDNDVSFPVTSTGKYYLITFLDTTTVSSNASNITPAVVGNRTAGGVARTIEVDKKTKLSDKSVAVWFKITNPGQPDNNLNTFVREFTITRSTGNSITLTGSSTQFASELKPQMKLSVGGSVVSVLEIISETLRISGTVTAGTYYGIKKLIPKIKSLGPNFYTKILSTPVKSATDLSYYKSTTETKLVDSGFTTISTTANYTISPNDITVTNNSGSVLFTTSDETGYSVKINVSPSLNGTNINVSYKVRINDPSIKTKVPQTFKVLKVNKQKSDTNTIYGTRISDKEISLKFADVYKIHTIREIVNTGDSDNSLFDKVTVNDVSGILVGDIIYKDNIKAKVIQIQGTILYLIYLSSEKFQEGSNLSTSINVISKNTISGKYITASTSGRYKDITKDFSLVKNDGPEFYNISKLVRYPSSAIPQNNFLVVFDYFSHDNLSNDLYTTNSYNFDEIQYSEVPSCYDGTPYTDIIDFRYYASPSPTTGTSGTIGSPYVETTSVFNLYPSSTTSRNISSFIFPGDVVNVDYDHYMGRIDKVFLDENGNLVVAKGSQSLTAQPPEDIPGALHLVTLNIPPYMKDVNDVVVTFVDSKRYTMKDIGSIDKRLKVVEELTSLSLLEIDTNNLNITDADGNNRFKTGFVADNFKTTQLANLNNVNYTASIDTENALLRPYPYITSTSLKYNSSSSSKITGSIVTIPYTEVSYITQSYASRVENLQPFEVIQWDGELILNPDRDVWFDTVRTSTNTQRVDLSEPIRFLFDNSGASGDQWNAWQSVGSQRTGGGTNVFQERTGVNNSFSTLTQDIQVGDTINSVAPSTFMRSRIVDMTCVKLKPNTLFHFFIDDVLNNLIVYPKHFTNMTRPSTGAGTFVIGETVDMFYSPPPGVVVTMSIPSNRVLATVASSSQGTYSATSTYLSITNIRSEDGTNINVNGPGNSFTIVGRSSGARASVDFSASSNTPRLKSDSLGTVEGFVLIPPQTYSTGTSTFKLCDQVSGTTIYGISDSNAETPYNSEGTVVNLTSNVLSLTTPQITTTPISGRRTVFVPDPPPPPPPAPPAGRDPLAQSFFVENMEGGMFATSIDLYFQTKDSTIPVSIELRTMENGTLTETMIPNSTVTVQAADVKVSNNSLLPTRFTFKSPIYLSQNTEYAFVVRTNSKEYKIWVSRLGEQEINGKFIIDKQPYSGSLYKSQNMSVWTPDQFEDIKFVLNRAKFVTNATYTCKLSNLPVPSISLPPNPFKFTASSGLIEVYHPNHGMNSKQNYVKINGVISQSTTTTLNTTISSTTQSGNITIGNATDTSWSNINGVAVSANNPGYILVKNEIIKYTSISGTTLTIPSDGRAQFGTTASSHSIGDLVSCYSLNGIPLSQINKVHKITEIVDLDRYKITSQNNASASLVGGGSGGTASRNIAYEEIFPNIALANIPSTNVNLTFDSVSGNSINTPESSFSVISSQPVQNKQYLKLSSPRIITSPVNSDEYFDSLTYSSLTFNVNMSTEKDNLSPFIHVNGSSAVTISNRIFKKVSNNTLDISQELTPSSGVYSSYITKKITLQNTSTSIKVLLDAIRYRGYAGEYSDIKVFAKMYPDGNLGSFDNMNYVEIPAVSYPSSSTSNEYKSFDFELKNLAEFKEFSIKICMISNDQTNIPVIRNFRAIALAV